MWGESLMAGLGAALFGVVLVAILAPLRHLKGWMRRRDEEREERIQRLLAQDRQEREG